MYSSDEANIEVDKWISSYKNPNKKYTIYSEEQYGSKIQ